MPTTSHDDKPQLSPQLCIPRIHAPHQNDEGITAFRGMLVAGTASIVLWGVCIVLIMMLRSRG
jgi:hypothetical protein